MPELNVLELPYLFRSLEEADHIIDTVITEPMAELFRRYGLVLGFWNENGFRHIGSKDKPIIQPADLKGRKMRSQESPVHLETWKAYGASPVPIPTTEVLTALQTLEPVGVGARDLRECLLLQLDHLAAQGIACPAARAVVERRRTGVR